MKRIAAPFLCSLPVLSALLGTAAIASAPGIPNARIAVHGDYYVVGAKAFDDLNTLEKSIRIAASGLIEIDSCGPSSTRALRSVAHRFRDLPLVLRTDTPACAADTFGIRVQQPVGSGPTGVDDAAVNAYWRQVTP